jgi:uncharacterized protein with HEPN domain
MWRDDATLLDMLRAANLALEFRGQIEKTAFMGDLKTQAAVVHELLVLGEAVKRLSGPFREQHPEVPWKAIAGMRDRLLHGYDDVDLDLVWKTVVEHLPTGVRSPGASPHQWLRRSRKGGRA